VGNCWNYVLRTIGSRRASREAESFLRKLEDELVGQSKYEPECLLCGALATTKEHVIPKWLQHSHDLFCQKLMRPNGTSIAYGRITVALCEKCNNETLSELENYISRMARSGFGENHVHDRQLHLWLIKLYLFLQNFEHARRVYLHGQEPKSLVGDDQLFDTQLLRLLLVSIKSDNSTVYPEQDFVSVWIYESSADLAAEDFLLGISGGQNILALKIHTYVIFSVLGDWGQYRVAGALDRLSGPIDLEEFTFGFNLLRFLVHKNRIPTSFVLQETPGEQYLRLLPNMIRAEDMNMDVNDYQAFLNRAD